MGYVKVQQPAYPWRPATITFQVDVRRENELKVKDPEEHNRNDEEKTILKFYPSKIRTKLLIGASLY